MTTFADLVPSPAGRFDGIERPYTPDDVLRLRGSVPVTHTLAERGANRLWQLLHDEPFINALRDAVSFVTVACSCLRDGGRSRAL